MNGKVNEEVRQVEEKRQGEEVKGSNPMKSKWLSHCFGTSSVILVKQSERKTNVCRTMEDIFRLQVVCFCFVPLMGECECMSV